MTNSNNPPDVVLELTQDEADFLLENCKNNIQFGLNAMQQLDPEFSREAMQDMANLLDHFKNVMKKLRKAGANED